MTQAITRRAISPAQPSQPRRSGMARGCRLLGVSVSAGCMEKNGKVAEW